MTTKKLSKQENQILKGLKNGLKNREIAESLLLSEKTVSTYVLRIRKKLGIDQDKNVYYLVCKAIELGFTS